MLLYIYKKKKKKKKKKKIKRRKNFKNPKPQNRQKVPMRRERRAGGICKNYTLHVISLKLTAGFGYMF